MSETHVTDIQTLVMRLMRFWIDEGCYFLPAHDAPLSAAVQHPQAFLGLFDRPSSRRVAFLQPVRRPRDSRHGHQPYRLSRHLQLAVLLTPSPDDLVACYLRSLRALGLQLDLHDLRFAEGDWSMPAFGAWGLGWSVRIEGMGVTRLTLLQAAGGVELSPVRAEIVYGVERLATCLSGSTSVYDVAWSADGPSVGALYRLGEEERSRDDLELADPSALEARWLGALAATDDALDAGLIGTAYEAAVRASFALERLAARQVLERGAFAAGRADVAERIGRIAEATRERAASRLDEAPAADPPAPAASAHDAKEEDRGSA